MKSLPLAILSFFAISCAHDIQMNKTVQFPFAEELLQKVQMAGTRMPASMSVEDMEEISPRRVYFSALYHQYLILGKHLGKKSEMSFCPQFHHDKIQTDSSMLPLVSFYPARDVVDHEGKAYFPELAFNRKFSLNDYHKVIEGELVTLCEEGVSDNYYKFDNLVTHYAHKSSFHKDPKAMTAVLKIPVFANFYLVKMLETQGLGLTSPEEKRFIKLTRTYWFENYVAEAGKMRNNFIKNKMVSR